MFSSAKDARIKDLELELTRANRKIGILEDKISRFSIAKIDNTERYVIDSLTNVDFTSDIRLGTLRVKSNGFTWSVALKRGVWGRSAKAGKPQGDSRINGASEERSLIDLVEDIKLRGQLI